MQHIHHVLSGHIAAGAFGIGTSAQASDGRVNGHDTQFQSCQQIGQRLTVRVVKVHGKLVGACFLQTGTEYLLHLQRCAHTNGVANRDFITPQCHQFTHCQCDISHRNRALIGTTHGARHITAHRNALCTCRLAHIRKALDTLADTAIDIFLTEGFRGRGKYRNFIGAGSDSALKTLQIRGQRGIAHAGQSRY